MTAAQLRALRAVRDGQCERRYHSNGNTMHTRSGSRPVAAAVLHRLSTFHYIKDENAHGYRTNYKLELTDKGRQALKDAE